MQVSFQLLLIPFIISPLRRGVSNLLFVQSFCLHPSPLSDQLRRRKDAQLDIIIPTSPPRLRYLKILQDIVRYYKISKDIIRYFKILQDIIRYYKISKDIIRYFQTIQDMIRYCKISYQSMI